MRVLIGGGLALALSVAGVAGGVVANGASGSGIHGRVTSGPTCPVETMPPSPQCAPRGFRARVRISAGGRLVKRLTTDAQGRFSVTLRAGSYRVSAAAAAGGPYPRCPAPTNVKVRPNRYARVTINCDTGIR